MSSKFDTRKHFSMLILAWEYKDQPFASVRGVFNNCANFTGQHLFRDYRFCEIFDNTFSIEKL